MIALSGFAQKPLLIALFLCKGEWCDCVARGRKVTRLAYSTARNFAWSRCIVVVRLCCGLVGPTFTRCGCRVLPYVALRGVASLLLLVAWFSVVAIAAHDCYRYHRRSRRLWVA